MFPRKYLGIVKRSLKSSGTYHAQWMITNRCNYRCRGCTVWENQNGKELNAKEIIKGLAILRSIGIIEIVFSGGNPLIREDIDEILDYASKYFITTIYDNGSLALKKIDVLRKVDFVAISLDTLNEEKNDYLKNSVGAWKNAMNSITLLKKEGINVGVSPTISQINLHDIVDLTKFFINRQIPVWYCLYGYDHQFKNSIFPLGKQNENYEIKEVDKLVEVCNKISDLRKHNPYVYITEKTIEAVKELALTGKRIWKCRALSTFLVINPLGRVAACHNREPVASIFNLSKVWKSKKFDKLRLEYNKCTKCNYLCYIFYSIHSGISGNFEILSDQWKNVKNLIKKY